MLGDQDRIDEAYFEEDFCMFKNKNMKDILLYTYFCLVGIGWKKDQIKMFQATELELDQLVIPLQITCNADDIFTVNLVEYRDSPTVGFFSMMLSLPNDFGWETFPCQMTFENISHSWINVPPLEQMNDEFSTALETQISSIYRKSFVYKYYNVDVRSHNGIVYFHNMTKDKETVLKTDRFTVQLKIPDKTKPYFKSATYWDTIFGPDEWPEWVPAQTLSQVSNGTLSHSTPGTKNHLYTPPFSISFISQGIEGNYFSFNRFNSPNLEDSILAMLFYETTTNTFVPFFDPYLIIPYKDHIALPQNLEFKILDSNKRHVHISEKSQLFVVLTLM